MSAKEEIIILGAGPVGSLLSIYLAKKGFAVSVYEKRNDIRNSLQYQGKSINIALSERGWSSLSKVGMADKIKAVSLPMYGRMVHKDDGTTHFQAYSTQNEAIYSVSRGDVNKILISEAEKLGVKFHFDQHCKRIDLKTNQLYFRNTQNELTRIDNPKICISAEGAYSSLRNELIKHQNVNYSQEYLAHGYLEIQLKSASNGKWQLPNNALHIWPRNSFMLIALPNLDGSFTCTLFLQKEGEISIEKLKTKEGIVSFFQKYFEDVMQYIPDLVSQVLENPVGNLLTVKCYPWYRKEQNTHYCLIGDAAHAITPFYGQGMNSGFEDVEILASLLEKENNWEIVFKNFEKARKQNTDAIAEMAFQNFKEMSDGVVNEDYLKIREIEKLIAEQYPNFQTKYEKVSFSKESYSDILDFATQFNNLILSLLNKKANNNEILLALDKFITKD